MAPPEMPSALAGRQIAGYCVAEPFGAMGLRIGKGHVLYRSEGLWPNSICCGLVFNDKSLASKGTQLEKVIDAYMKAGKHVSDKGVALKEAKKILRQPEEVLEQSLKWISYDQLNITQGAYDDLCHKVKQYGIIDNPPAYREFVK